MLQRNLNHDIRTELLEEAADWLVRLNDDEISDSERQKFEHWRETSSEHRHAWQRAEQLTTKFDQLPANVTNPLFQKSHLERRRSIKKLLLFFVVAPVSWSSWKLASQQGWTSDYHTAVGEQRELKLVDGTLLAMNTNSAVDVQFSEQKRLIHLRRGEVLIETGADDASAAHRPFKVLSSHGMMEALGTKFSVRQYDEKTTITVLEGAVRVTPAKSGPMIHSVVSAGQQLTFNKTVMSEATSAVPASTAWKIKMLIADNMLLRDFIVEFNRYYKGIVRCDPSIANISLSGAYPLDNAEKTLNMLAKTYPVSIGKRFGGYLVTLLPR